MFFRHAEGSRASFPDIIFFLFPFLFLGASFGQYTLAYFPLYGEVRLDGFGFGIQNGR